MTVNDRMPNNAMAGKMSFFIHMSRPAPVTVHVFNSATAVPYIPGSDYRALAVFDNSPFMTGSAGSNFPSIPMLINNLLLTHISPRDSLAVTVINDPFMEYSRGGSRLYPFLELRRTSARRLTGFFLLLVGKLFLLLPFKLCISLANRFIGIFYLRRQSAAGSFNQFMLDMKNIR